MTARRRTGIARAIASPAGSGTTCAVIEQVPEIRPRSASPARSTALQVPGEAGSSRPKSVWPGL